MRKENPKHVAQRFCHGNLKKITRKEKNNYEPQNKKKLYEIKWMYMYSHVLLQQVVIAKQKKNQFATNTGVAITICNALWHKAHSYIFLVTRTAFLFIYSDLFLFFLFLATN